MRIFDPHIHMYSRTTDDYEAMYAAGVRAVVEPAFWQGQPRTSPESFYDYFDALLGWEPYRAAVARAPAQIGIDGWLADAASPSNFIPPFRCAAIVPRSVSARVATPSP